MSRRQTINTNIRLNLANEDDRKAWTYLQNLDRKKYIVTVVENNQGMR